MTTITIVGAAEFEIGAWAFIISTEGKTATQSGCCPGETQHRSILKGLMRALDESPSSEPIEVLTNSTLVVDGMRTNLRRWLVNGWRTVEKKPVQHADLWQLLHDKCADRQITWTHIGNETNTQLDALRAELKVRLVRQAAQTGVQPPRWRQNNGNNGKRV